MEDKTTESLSRPRPASRRRENSSYDAEWFSSTVGAIYDCVLSPEDWSETLRHIGERFGFTSALLGVIQLRPGAHQMLTHFGFDDDWLAAEHEYTEEMFDLWGGRAKVDAFPLEEPILASDVTPPARFAENRYYRDILEPRKLHEGIVVTLARDANLAGYLGLNRHISAGPVRPEQHQGLRLLAPHVRRAVTISNFFDLKAVEHRAFHSVIKSMQHAVLLVDADGLVSDTNRVADSLLASNNSLEIVGGHLKLANPAAQRELDAALRLAADDEAKLERRGIGLPVTAEGSAPLILHLMPLAQTGRRRGFDHQAVAAVFIVSASHKVKPPMQAIALLYSLTPAEALIFAAIAEGKTLDETSSSLGIGRGTAKTHLLRIFHKTGCNRQAELVALAHHLAAPM